MSAASNRRAAPGAAAARLKVNPPIGQLPVLQYCSPDQLAIDPAYQRGLDEAGSQALIRRIAMHWDWGLCQPLFVARRDDGGLYVVDGQHRLAAARLRGDIWQLPCVVVQQAGAEQEAASFVALNGQRRPLTRLDIYKAALAAGNEKAVCIARALADAGLSVAPHTNPNSWKPGQLINISGLELTLHRHGEGVLRAGLSLLAEAFAGQVLRCAGTIWPGIAALAAAMEPADRPGILALLCSRSPLEWNAAILARRVRDNCNMQKASVRALRAAWRGGEEPEPAPPPPGQRARQARRSAGRVQTGRGWQGLVRPVRQARRSRQGRGLPFRLLPFREPLT